MYSHFFEKNKYKKNKTEYIMNQSQQFIKMSECFQLEKALLNKSVFTLVLKESTVWSWQISMGNLFHSFGPHTEKARSPVHFWAERFSFISSWYPDQSNLDGAYIVIRYWGVKLIKDLKTSKRTLNSNLYLTGSQCSRIISSDTLSFFLLQNTNLAAEFITSWNLWMRWSGAHTICCCRRPIWRVQGT